MRKEKRKGGMGVEGKDRESRVREKKGGASRFRVKRKGIGR